VVNRWWELVDANDGIALFTRHVTPELMRPPVNVLRVSLHPDGMAPRIANLPEWRAHLLARLHRQAEATADQRLIALHDELSGYPGGGLSRPPPARGVVVPLRYRADGGELSFISMTAVVGTPMDITVAELAIESFYPADEPTATALRS
jgi:MmyB-like transcription regulator ligand binding domain